MSAVAFETPGLLDVRAITIIGAHAKPNSPNPIGFFGTGLKYAIAVAVRLGAEPVIWIGRDRFTFSKKTSTFRGTDLETIKMTVLKDGNKRATAYELPFTTRYGARWEPWMAFRELESNTRDEGGATYLIEDPDVRDRSPGLTDRTYVIVDHPDFVEAFEKVDETFLPRGSRAREGAILEAFEGESTRLFYRTMRAKDLQKPSIFTYNIIESMDLTEDRTLKHEYYARDAVARWVLTDATADQVERVLKAEENDWEHGLEFPGRVRPSDAFREVMVNRRRGISKNAWGYYGAYAGAGDRRRRVETKAWRLADEHPRPWKVEGLVVVDAKGNEIFTAPDGYYEDWDRTAEAIVERINLIGRLASKEKPPAAELAAIVAEDVVDEPAQKKKEEPWNEHADEIPF